MAKNKKLNDAKRNKKDEFYTLLKDIENELQYYTHHLKDKVIYCNCDNPEWSNFWVYFETNFHTLGLKKLIATFYHPTNPVYKLEYDGKEKIKTPLQGDGRFDSEECVATLQEADIVVTNPPFSLFRDFFDLLTTYEKDFLVVGNINAVTYKNVFPFIKENKVRTGITRCNEFMVPDEYVEGR